MRISFTAVYEDVPEAEGGGYVAYVEELPGAITEGETIEEARENLQDAVNELLEANRLLASRSQAGCSVTRESITVNG